jgi:hypothetical protein
MIRLSDEEQALTEVVAEFVGLAIGSATMIGLAVTLLLSGVAHVDHVGFDLGRLGLGVAVLAGPPSWKRWSVVRCRRAI